MAPVAGFEALDLPPLANLRSLADWLMVTSQQLSYVADLHHRYEAHDDMAVNHYHYHIHRKKGGGLRLVEAPKQGLKAIQRQILRGILDNIPTHPDAFGFVKGRNCVEAAMRHTGEVAVLRFDLKDFFPSIQIMRVFGLFRCLGYPHEVSHNLTALCTTATPPRVLARLDASDRMIYRTAHLPQGAPTSPALANLVSHGLDRRLTGLAGKLDARYSRYADDLSFSGDARIIRPLMKWLPKITAEEGFHLNLEKTRIMAHGSRKMVTGVTVNQHVNVNRFTFDRLKAVIHACGNPEDTRFSDGSFVTSLLGQIGWVEQVNPVRGQKLRRLLAKSWERRFGR